MSNHDEIFFFSMITHKQVKDNPEKFCRLTMEATDLGAVTAVFEKIFRADRAGVISNAIHKAMLKSELKDN